MRTLIVGSSSGGTPTVSNSLATRVALLKSRTSTADRNASFSAIRCSSTGKAPMEAPTVLKMSRASAQRPWRA